MLVTGGAGYTGIPLCGALIEAGHHVTVVDNFVFGFTPLLHLIDQPNLEVVRTDIRDDDRSYLKDKDVIFHLAGISGYPACEANPNSARLINVTATEELVRALAPDQLLIFASTTSFYGASGTESQEDDPITPVNLYGETKKIGEDIVMDRENSIALRWATVFGVSSRMRNDLMVNDFVEKAINERTLVLYDANSTRTFMHLTDQTRGYLFALDNLQEMTGGIYNMGSASLNYTKRQIAENIQERIPCEIMLAKSGDMDVRNFLVNFDKALKLGFDCEFTLQQGIDELIKLYKFYAPNPVYG